MPSQLISLPSGAILCEACQKAKHPTFTVDDGDGMQTACEACTRPYEQQGCTTARAVEEAIADSHGHGKVTRRGAMYRRMRRKHNIREGEAQGAPKLFDTGEFDEAEQRRERRRQAA